MSNLISSKTALGCLDSSLKYVKALEAENIDLRDRVAQSIVLIDQWESANKEIMTELRAVMKQLAER